MTPFEREIARQRRRLLQIERNGASEMVSAYQRLHRRLERDLGKLTAAIDAARAAGEDPKTSWLYRQQRYQTLLVQVESETRGFAKRAIEIIESGQSEALIYAPKDAQALALAAAGTAPAEAVATIRSSWTRVPDDALRRLVGNMADGAPLGDLLRELAPRAVERVRDTLAFGMAIGRPVRRIARDFQAASGATLTRSLRIARTETLGAYRQATVESYRANQDVVRGWTWWAAIDTRTCASCWGQHGSEHSLDESLASHVNCRCTMVPRTATWQELGFDVPDTRPPVATGEEVFARLPAEEQLAVLGPSKHAAYAAGEIRLGDLVEHTNHPRWGAGTREATLAVARAQAARRALVAA